MYIRINKIFNLLGNGKHILSVFARVNSYLRDSGRHVGFPVVCTVSLR